MTFNPNEDRDEKGKWTAGGAVSDPNDEVRPKGSEMWGESHTGSMQITADAAKIMGISGYKQLYKDGSTRETRGIANRFLEGIRDSSGSVEPLYHGFQNVKGVVWKAGDTFKVPLLATSGDIDTSAQYGAGGEPPTIFEFPKGTRMAGYAKASEANAKEKGHIWNEALVAGEFRVVGVRQASSATWVRMTVVRLEPKSVFDPNSKRWV